MPVVTKAAVETAAEAAPPVREGETITTPKGLRDYAAVRKYETLFGPMQGPFAQ